MPILAVRHCCLVAEIAGLSAMLLAAASLPCVAQEVGDAAAGRRLAETWCSNCHVVSPTAERATANGVPTFTGIAQMPSTTPMSLNVFLQTSHSRMPDLHVSRQEIDDLTAYILSLRR
jgi:mono/diheme cytochrome c family protein